MFDLGPYSFFIWASYLSVFIVLGGLVTWIVLDERQQKKLLAGLESDED